MELVVSLKDVRGKKWSEWFVVLPHCVHGLICIFCKTRKFLNLISCFMLDSASLILHIYPLSFFLFWKYLFYTVFIYITEMLMLNTTVPDVNFNSKVAWIKLVCTNTCIQIIFVYERSDLFNEIVYEIIHSLNPHFSLLLLLL